jgi:NADPH:quinone reductase-like Zn-dependent oxidoreductase
LGTGYRQLLGPYADVILRDGQVPWGSEEHMNYIVSCIRSAGFDVEPEIEGGTTGYRVVAGPQGTQLSEVQSACEQAAADAGLVGELPTTKSREFLTALYQAATFEYQCLVEHGFNPTEPPSEEWYIDNGGAWDPFADLPIEEYYAAEDVCTRNTVEILEQIVASGQATTP